MKKIFLFLSFFALIACTSVADYTLSEKDNGKIVIATVNNEILINLNANVTTGYSWHFTAFPSSAFELIEEKYKENTHPIGMVGVGGKSFYKIKLLKRGKLTVEARYFRSWEKFNPKTDKFLNFIIEVK